MTEKRDSTALGRLITKSRMTKCKRDLGTEKDWAKLARKNRNENVEIDDENKED